MEVIFVLIAISLILAGSFLFLFFRAMKGGQFDDNHTPAIRILFDNEPKTKDKKEPSPSTKSK
ncbi:cbb3-type cytochrome oxidase assembly protein CcoS [Aquiflexum gelatinilyticum]|jgi:cbb3-type cytochrome oxidase maturation protein|uniref:cbb3-type cytochrome oxidase assembly protein CcoS n=1 Tax=Aquiflexum gelatinilyticum TaxID=2961943 RepID=UPI002167DC26|nr:cbb3-type cytochrome oxidase assembly protein CcoS [Aquiflexum gelatinilyticum]MCS4435071.1 cbb3-type cytochrome oxidase assembly protein CcoS [Aquiflexum gelatinilyticum]